MMAFLEASVSKIKQGLDRTARRIVIGVGARLVMRSPVGDATYWKSPPPAGYVGGRFRANWQHGFGVAPSGEISGQDKSGRIPLAGITSSVNNSPAAGIHYIANNLPYSMAIENGHSRQAPQGVVGLTALEFPEIVRKVQE